MASWVAWVGGFVLPAVEQGKEVNAKQLLAIVKNGEVGPVMQSIALLCKWRRQNSGQNCSPFDHNAALTKLSMEQMQSDAEKLAEATDEEMEGWGWYV